MTAAPAAVEEVDCGEGGVEDGGMAKQYVPSEVEERLYKWWESKGYFKVTTHYCLDWFRWLYF